jgi:hypothetical protein
MEYNFKKVCEKCRKKFPDTPEYFSVNYENKSKLSQNCRVCSPAERKKPSKKREKYVITDEKKSCAKCKEMKKFIEFPINKRMICGYDSYCRKCHRDMALKHYSKNPQKYDPKKITQREKYPEKWYEYLKKYNRNYAKDPLKRKKLSINKSVFYFKKTKKISQPTSCECQECGQFQEKLRSWFPDSLLVESSVFGLEIIKENLKWLCNKCLYSKRAKPKKKE